MPEWKNVACSLSKEITARLISEITGKNPKTDFRWSNFGFPLKSNFHRWQYSAILCSIRRGPEAAPARTSTIARWMIKYVLRRRCSRCFTNTIMVMIFRMTIARHSAVSTIAHGIHSEGGIRIQSCWPEALWVLLLILLAIQFRQLCVAHKTTWKWRRKGFQDLAVCDASFVKQTRSKNVSHF